MNIQPQTTINRRDVPAYLNWLASQDSFLEARIRSIAENLESGQVARSADHPLVFFDRDPLWILCWRKLSPSEVTAEESQKAGGEIWQFYLLDYSRPSEVQGESVYYARVVGRRTRNGLIDGWDHERWKLCSKTDAVWTVLGEVEKLKILVVASLGQESWHLNYSEFFDRALRLAIIKVQLHTYADVYD